MRIHNQNRANLDTALFALAQLRRQHVHDALAKTRLVVRVGSNKPHACLVAKVDFEPPVIRLRR
jgi:hypothetical protein